MTANARDVIARAIAPGAWAALDGTHRFSEEFRRVARNVKPESIKRADTAIVSLADAGFEIVQRDDRNKRYETGYADGGADALDNALRFLEKEMESNPAHAEELRELATYIEGFTWPVKLRDAPLPPTPGPFKWED